MSDSVKLATKASVTEFLSGFQKLRLERNMIDLTIVTMGQHEVSVHSLVLIAHFPRIRSVLMKYPRDKLLLTRFPLRVIEAAVDYAYTGLIAIDEEYALQLYLLSYNLGSKYLRDLCTGYIVPRITRTMVGDVWAAANSVQDEALMRRCLPVLQNKLEDLAVNSRFIQYTGIRGMLLLCKVAHGSENTLERLICQWIDEPDSAAQRQRDRLTFEELVEELLCLQDLATELGVSRSCRNHLIEAIKAERSRSRRLTYLSSKNSSTDKDAEAPHRTSDMVYAVVERSTKYYLTNVAPLGNHDKIDVELPIDRGSEMTANENWVVALGGYKGPRQFTIFDLLSKRVFEGPPMIDGRHYSHAVAASGHFVFVFGGQMSEKNANACEVFDKSTNTWSHLPDSPSHIGGVSACTLPGEDVVVAGNAWGSCSKESLLLLSYSRQPNKRSWLWHRLPNLNRNRWRPAIAYHNDCIYVAGGNYNEYLDIECMFYPRQDLSHLQWTVILIPALQTHLLPLFMSKKGFLFRCGEYVFRLSSIENGLMTGVL